MLSNVKVVHNFILASRHTKIVYYNTTRTNTDKELAQTLQIKLSVCCRINE
jgi:hypothetical protein